MPKVSPKRRTRVYRAVDTVVMDARIAVRKILKDHKGLAEQVDDILYNANVDAPQAALDALDS